MADFTIKNHISTIKMEDIEDLEDVFMFPVPGPTPDSLAWKSPDWLKELKDYVFRRDLAGINCDIQI